MNHIVKSQKCMLLKYLREI